MIFSKVSNGYEALSQREKVLVLVSSLSGLFGLLFLLLIEPQYLVFKDSETMYQRIDAALDKNETQVQQLQQLLTEDLDQSIQQDIDDLMQQQKEISDALLQDSLSVLSPQELTEFLAEMLKLTEGLQVENFEVSTQAFSGADEILDEEEIFVLKQSVTVKLQGGEAALFAFLASLEAMPIAVVWDSIQYQQMDNSQRDVAIAFHLFSAAE
jgi:MSHA biogenesis protein MshJ